MNQSHHTLKRVSQAVLLLAVGYGLYQWIPSVLNQSSTPFVEDVLFGYGQDDYVTECGNNIIDADEQCEKQAHCSEGGVCEECQCIQCGNGLLETGEECEFNGQCSDEQVCRRCECMDSDAAVCGNRILEEGEQCEVNQKCSPGNACDAQCQCVESETICGDGKLEGSEECEASNQCGGYEECLNCFCVSKSSCGNGKVDSWEECETDKDCPKKGKSDICVSCECTPKPKCGNGVLEYGEECEEGKELNDWLCGMRDRIRRTCDLPTSEEKGTCVCVETEASCGNNVLDFGEECEKDKPYCGGRGTCDLEECQCTFQCGNGILEPGEECDGSAWSCNSNEECNNACACVAKNRKRP